MTCTLLQTRHVPSYKHDMYTPTNTTCILLLIRHVFSYKQDMYPPTNKTCTLLQTRHVPSYKQDMYPPTNKTCSLLQTTNGKKKHRFYVEIVTDITTRNLERKDTYCLLSNKQNAMDWTSTGTKTEGDHRSSGRVINTCCTKDNNRLLSFWIWIWLLVFNGIFSNVSAISWRPVLVVEGGGVPGENHHPGQATDKHYHLPLRVECTFL